MADAQQFKDFAGGTLVEYLMGQGYSREFGRTNILEVKTQGADTIHFVTDGKAHYATGIFQQLSMKEIGGVFYFDPPYLDFCYAIAPKGVVIPTPTERTFSI